MSLNCYRIKLHNPLAEYCTLYRVHYGMIVTQEMCEDEFSNAAVLVL